MVSEGRLTGGEVMTVFFCIMIGSFSIGNMIPPLSTVATARGAAAVLFDVIDEVGWIICYYAGFNGVL